MYILKTIEKILSDNIKSRRKELDLTQQEAADRAGLPFRTYQAIEYGQSWPEKVNLEAVAHGLDVHPARLLLDLEIIDETTALEILNRYFSEKKSVNSGYSTGNRIVIADTFKRPGFKPIMGA